MAQLIVMEIYMVLAIAFILGALFSFVWTKASFEKRLQKTKLEADKKIEDLFVENTIQKQRFLLINQERASVNAFENY